MTAADVYRALWRHKWLILFLTAVCVGAAWYATLRQAQAYEASTLVRVQERGQTAGSAVNALQASQDLARTYAKMIESGALAAEVRTLVAACAKTGSTPNKPTQGRKSASSSKKRAPAARRPSCAWLVGKRKTGLAPGPIAKVKLSASEVQDLDLLSISARNASSRRALLAAAAAPEALRAFIRRTAPISERVVTVKAATTSTLVSRHLGLNLAIALVLGLIFSGALALLIELFRDRLPDADELEQTLGHPVLATIPTLRLHRMAPPPSDGTAPPPVAIEPSVDGESAPRAAGSRASLER